MTTTTTSLTFTRPRPTASAPTSPCTTCGSPTSLPDLSALHLAEDRITELESQVKILTLRATSAVERANEYENEVRRLSNAAARSPPMISPSTTYPNISSAIVSPPASPPRSAANRLVRLLSTRSAASSGSVRPASPATPGHPPPNLPGPPNEGSQGPDQALREALTLEQSLRKEAETQSAKKDTEIEELSTQLFEQANEMVAVERRARAKLENRVEVLEKRDNDKAKRLGLLEMRVQRAERVRALLMREVKVDESEDGDEGETKMPLEKLRSMSE